MSNDSNNRLFNFSIIGSIFTGIFSGMSTYDYFKLSHLKDYSVSELSNSKILPSYICVSGDVGNHNAFNSQTNKQNLKVVYSKYIEIKYNQLGVKVGCSQKQIVKEFCLNQNKHQIYIQPTKDTNIMVDYAYAEKASLPVSWSSWFGSLFSSIAFFLTKFFLINIEVSQSIYEQVIPKDSNICAIGELKQVGDKLKIIPDYLAHSKSIILQDKKISLYILYAWQLLFGGFLLWSLYKRSKRREIIREEEERNREVVVRMPAGFECCICLENPRSIITDPCKHLSICLRCSENLDACPICRTPITAKTRVYFT